MKYDKIQTWNFWSQEFLKYEVTIYLFLSKVTLGMIEM